LDNSLKRRAPVRRTVNAHEDAKLSSFCHDSCTIYSDFRILMGFFAAADSRGSTGTAPAALGSWARLTSIPAARVSERSHRVDAACCLSLVHPPHGVTKPAGGVGDGRDRPRRRGFNEQPLPVDEIGRDGTPCIDASPGAVDVDKAKVDVTYLGLERPQGDRQLARRMFPQRFDRFDLTGTNQELNWNVHEHPLCICAVHAFTP
jgi:hypothetical protein